MRLRLQMQLKIFQRRGRGGRREFIGIAMAIPIEVFIEKTFLLKEKFSQTLSKEI